MMVWPESACFCSTQTSSFSSYTLQDNDKSLFDTNQKTKQMKYWNIVFDNSWCWSIWFNDISSVSRAHVKCTLRKALLFWESRGKRIFKPYRKPQMYPNRGEVWMISIFATRKRINKRVRLTVFLASLL